MNKDKVDVPITEQSNQLTQNIDQQNSLGEKVLSRNTTHDL